MARSSGQDSLRTDEIGFGTDWNPDLLDPDRTALPCGLSRNEVNHYSMHGLVVILVAMATWTRLCSIADCPPGEAREFVVEDRIIALFHTADSFYALDGVCPHQGGPLGKGQLSGTIVTCPWHGWQFDVTTGQHCTNASVLHPHLDVRVVNDEVQVDLSTDGNRLS